MSARAQFLGAGHYKPLADALVAFARNCPLPGNLVMEVGAGTAYYLAHIVDASAERAGLAVDLSRYAARRAAKANPRIASVVGDVWDRLPVADEASGLTIDVFAPRQPAELSRTLHRGGTLVVVTPQPQHLSELRGDLGLLRIDPLKEARIASGFKPHFRLLEKHALTWPVQLMRSDVEALVAMGPSARHVEPAKLTTRIAQLPEPVAITAAVTIQAYRRS